MPADPYSVLGVNRGCTEDELKSAYRRLAKQYHPDLHPDDPAAAARMNEINAAYERIKSGQADSYGAYSQPGNPYGAYSYDYRWQQDAWQQQQQQQYQYRSYTRSFHPGNLLLRMLLAFLIFRLIGSLLFGALFGSSYVYSYSEPQGGGQYYYYYYPGPETAPAPEDTL